MWRFWDWADDRWSAWHARKVVRGDEWADQHPRRWAVGLVPLSTWLRQPVTGWQSYRRVVGPVMLEREARQLGDDTP
jgi:hypothetical protein